MGGIANTFDRDMPHPKKGDKIWAPHLLENVLKWGYFHRTMVVKR